MLNDSNGLTSTVFLWEFKNMDVSPKRNGPPILKIKELEELFLFGAPYYNQGSSVPLYLHLCRPVMEVLIIPPKVPVYFASGKKND